EVVVLEHAAKRLLELLIRLGLEVEVRGRFLGRFRGRLRSGSALGGAQVALLAGFDRQLLEQVADGHAGLARSVVGEEDTASHPGDQPLNAEGAVPVGLEAAGDADAARVPIPCAPEEIDGAQRLVVIADQAAGNRAPRLEAYRQRFFLVPLDQYGADELL